MTAKRQKRDKAIIFEDQWRILASGAALPIPEYHFAKIITYRDATGKERKRNYRFDYAFVEEKVAIEVDGGQWSPHGGRHMTDRDREKQNCAAMLGWVVFHFSPAMLTNDPVHCIEQVKTALGVV